MFRRNLFPVAVAICGFLSLPASLCAAESIQGVTLQILPNGVRLCVVEDHRTPTVTHMVWYPVGSADEQIGESGLAHFLEHLMFKGTPRYPQGIFSKEIARQGGNDNAFTTLDYTAYFQRIHKDKLPLIMEMEADRMVNLVLEEKDVTTEREVVREERKMRTDSNPTAQLYEQMSAALYRNHPYGRPVIGWDHEIRQLGKEAALRFYKTHYRPENALVIVVGDVHPAEVKVLAEKIYGQIPKPNTPLPQNVRAEEPPQNVERHLLLQDTKVKTPLLVREYAVPSRKTARKGEAESLEITAYALGEGASSYLYDRLVRERKIASGVSASYDGLRREGGTFTMSLVLPQTAPEMAKKALEEAEKALDEDLKVFFTKPLAPDVYERALEAEKASRIFTLDSPMAQAHFYGAPLVLGMSLEDISQWPHRLAETPREGVVATSAELLSRDKSVTGLLVPTLP